MGIYNMTEEYVKEYAEKLINHDRQQETTIRIEEVEYTLFDTWFEEEN